MASCHHDKNRSQYPGTGGKKGGGFAEVGEGVPVAVGGRGGPGGEEAVLFLGPGKMAASPVSGLSSFHWEVLLS